MSPQELQVQKKRELEGKEESTIPARTFVPTADIYENSDFPQSPPGNARRRKGQCRRSRRGRSFVRGRPARFDQVPRPSAALNRIQHRQLFTELPAFKCDRSGQNRRRIEGRRAVVDPSEGREGKAA